MLITHVHRKAKRRKDESEKTKRRKRKDEKTKAKRRKDEGENERRKDESDVAFVISSFRLFAFVFSLSSFRLFLMAPSLCRREITKRRNGTNQPPYIWKFTLVTASRYEDQNLMRYKIIYLDLLVFVSEILRSELFQRIST